MSKKKQSFIFYKSWATLIANLTDEQAGELIKAICSFEMKQEIRIADPAVQAMFLMIKEKLQEDSDSYELKCENNKKSAEKRWGKSSEMQTHANATYEMRTHINKCERMRMDGDTDTDTDTDTDIKEKTSKKEFDSEPPGEGIEISDMPFEQFWSMYGKYKKVGEKYARLAFINAAIATDAEEIIKGLKKIIDLQWSRWPESQKQFIPKAENWLKGEHWKDEITAYEPQKTAGRIKIKQPNYETTVSDSKPLSQADKEAIRQLQKEMSI